MENKNIAILLSTYNGEQYVEELLDSILNQSYTNFHIYIRDDGSSDSTYDKLLRKQAISDKISLLTSNNNVGVKISFSLLINHALQFTQHEYFMFADQDDIWLEDKIRKTFDETNKYPQGRPLLIHTDMYVTDENLKILGNSFWKYQNINPKHTKLNRLLMQNVISGCNVLFNRELAVRSCVIPDEAIMHDWWLALVASVFGDISYIKEPTVYYRQHSANTIGAHRFDLKYIISRAFKQNLLTVNFIQAQKFREIYGNEMDDKQLEIFNIFCGLANDNYFGRLIKIVKYKFLKNGLLRNVRLLIKLTKV